MVLTQRSALARAVAIAALLAAVATASNSVAPSAPAQALDDFVFLGSWGNEIGVFHGPAGLAVKGERVYLCNQTGNTLDVFDLLGRPIQRVGGAGYIGEPGLFWHLSAVTIDSHGTIFAADAANHRIQLFSADGTYLSQWGSHGLDPGRLNQPEAIAVDDNDDIWVADTYNHRIQKFGPTGTLLQEPWGKYGSGEGDFIYPRGIAVGPDGSIYVADSGDIGSGDGNHRIQRFRSDGSFLGEWGELGTGPGQFNVPMNLIVDPVTGQVYVSDYGNHRVQLFSATGGFVRQWGEEGVADGQFSFPYGIGLGTSGDVFISEYGNHRVQRFTPMGVHVATWGGSGKDNAQFNRPSRTALGLDETVYVSDTWNHRIQVLTQDGSYLGQWGSYGTADGQFDNPMGVAVDGDGHVYVADRYNHRLQKFGPDGIWIDTWGSGGSAPGQFLEPVGVAVAGDSVFVSEVGNYRVQQFTTDGVFVRAWGSYGSEPGDLISPWGLAVDPARGWLYVADLTNLRVHRFTTAGEYLESWSLGLIVDVAVDAAGNLFALDQWHHWVTQLDWEGNLLSVWGSQGSQDGQLSYPGGIAVDSGGTVYISDSSNHRISRYAADYPAPDSDYGLTFNGSFEESPALVRWTYGGALPVTVVPSARDGIQGARLAEVVPAAPRPREEGWLHQTVHIPSGWERPVLTFDYRIYANDTIDYSDFEVTLTQSDGAWLARILRDGFRSCDDPPLAPPEGFDLGWRNTRYDLSAFKGRTVRVRFAVHNLHADYSYGIWAVVDNVRLVDAGPVLRNYLPIVSGGRHVCDVVPGR